jgi:hypothetical protein
MRTTYTVAEWPDAKILRIMPTGGGLELISSLVDDADGGWRLKSGSQHTDLWWSPLKSGSKVIYAYVRKDQEGQRPIPPQMMISVLRLPGKMEGTPYLIDQVAVYPQLIQPGQDDTLKQALKRFNWFFFDVLGLDIDHDVETFLRQELRIPFVLDTLLLSVWETSSTYCALLEATKVFKEFIPDSTMRKAIFALTGKWLCFHFDAKSDMKGIIPDEIDQEAWRWWRLDKSGMRKLVFSLEISPKKGIIFAVSESNMAPDLGSSSDDPLEAMFNAGVLVPETKIDTWLDANIDPGKEVVDTRVYAALGADSPYLWSEEAFVVWAKEQSIR